MNIVFGCDREVGSWVASRIANCVRGFGPSSAIGIEDEGNLIAGVVYHDYSPESGVIEISAASESKKWLSRPNLYVIFSYPFDQLKVQMVVMRTEASNKQSNGRGIERISKSYGFSQINIPRLYGRAKDGILHTLTEEAWRSNGYH